MTDEYIDADRFQRLARDLAGDVRSCLTFVDDFLGTWPERCHRVHRAVGGGGLEDALAALLSIGTSSRMLGAERLGVLALELHADARMSRVMPAHGAERLGRVGDASCDALLRLTAPLRSAESLVAADQTVPSTPVIR